MQRRDPLKDATIVFDLDGTLVDTAPDLTNALEPRADPPRPCARARGETIAPRWRLAPAP